MNSRFYPAVLASLVLVVTSFGAKPVSDIHPAEQRRPAVERAERLAHPPAPAALPSDLQSPFSPPGFERGDGAEPRTGESRSAADGKPALPAAPATDRDLVASVAAKIPTTGTMFVGGRPLLVSGRNRIEVGSHFTVVYNGQEYELELVAIDRTTFTVRYKGEEFTRPIKLGKTP